MLSLIYLFFQARKLSSFSENAAVNSTGILEDVTQGKQRTLSARKYVACKFYLSFLSCRYVSGELIRVAFVDD